MRKYIAICFLAMCMCTTGAIGQEENWTIDEFYPQGTKWTELRLDTLKHDSWYSGIYIDGILTWVPNYEKVEFYVDGDTTTRQDHFNIVWKDTQDGIHLPAYLLCVKRRHEQDYLALSIYNDTLGDVCVPAVVYDFNAWEMGAELWYEPFSIRELLTGFGRIKTYGIISESETGNFGGTRDLEYITLDVPTIGETIMIHGIGVTSWRDRDCIFGQSRCQQVENVYLDAMPDYRMESQKNHYRSILVHFERGGEVLYDLWPNEKGELVTRIPSPREASRDGHTAYDLQGRKVTGKPSRGLYIIGGKKRVVK